MKVFAEENSSNSISSEPIAVDGRNTNVAGRGSPTVRWQLNVEGIRATRFLFVK